MAEHHHRCPACDAGAPRGARFCPACGTALDAPSLPLDAPSRMATEHEVALGARHANRRRSALLVAAVAVGVLGAGLVVGAGRGDDGSAGVSPSTSIAPPSSTEPQQSPRTLKDLSTTTSTVFRPATTPIRELVGQVVYAVVHGRVVRVDPTTGTATMLNDRRPAQDWGSLVARQGGVVLSDETAVFFPDDGSAPVDLGSGHAWAATDPTLVWMAGAYRSSTSTARLVRVEDGKTITTFKMAPFAFPVGADGAGRLVLNTSTSGTYTIDPAAGGIARLRESGLVVEATATHLVLVRCDAQLVCGYELVDRVSGAAVAVALGAATASTGYGGFALDPTASTLAWVDHSGSLQLSVIEIASGTVTELGGVQDSGPGSAPRWTADGQHLVWVERSSIAVWTVGTDEPALYQFRSGERLLSVSAVSLRT